MNAVEIEEAITALAAMPFDPSEFPFAFLQAFGNKETTLKRLRKGESNKSDVGGVLQTNNIHLAVSAPGEVTRTLAVLKASPTTARAKAKFILATDGDTFEAEDLASGERIACDYSAFPDHFAFFLPLAGITTVQQVGQLVRHPGDESPEPALRRTPEGQSGMGYGKAPPGHEPLHVQAYLLLLRGGHGYLSNELRTAAVHVHRGDDERSGFVQYT